MVVDLSPGVLGTLLGTVAGSIVGGWFGLKQTRLQQKAENKRRQADVFLDKKAERLAVLYDYLIEVTSLSSAHPNRNRQDISEGLKIHKSALEEATIPSSQELLRAHQHAMLFVSDEEGIDKINDAIGLWIPVLRAIESDTTDSIYIRWENIPVQDSIRKYPDSELSHEEVQEISDEAISVLRDEIHGPIDEL